MKNLLALDTSTDRASLALLTGDTLSTRLQIGQKTHAECLLPLIDELLNEAGLSLKQLDAIVFGSGPGSFTGLRIACSIAKGLAYALDIGLIPVSTLQSIAYGVRQQKEYANHPILAVLDARMHQVYWCNYARDSLEGLLQVSPVSLIKLTEPVLLAGVGIPLYWEEFPQRLIIDKIETYPMAANMIGFAKATQLKPISAVLAEPQYVRNQVTDKA